MLDEESDEQRLARLFQEYLAADERGLRRDTELLRLAGDSRASLAAKIRLHRELKALGEAEAEANAPEARQRFGRFEILGSLGEGGISRVLLAFDPKLGRRIALKLIQREMLLDQTQRAWILNEARGLAGTAHRGVVQVYEVGEAGPHTYVAMELLSGPSLHEVIAEWARQRDGGPAPEAPPFAEDRRRAEATRELATRLAPFSRRIELLAELAEALAHCHDHGVLHRDIKPKNVLFDGEGHPKLIDFGLAHVEGADEDSRLGLTQNLVGTAAYLAPEQVTNERTGADPRSDQFSFGTLAYECFALENPFQRGSQRAISVAIEEADPPPLGSRVPALPPDVVRVIRHAHEQNPDARYPSLSALAADLRAILVNRPVSIADPSLLHLGRLWLRRHQRGVLIGGATLALALSAGVGLWATTVLDVSRTVRDELTAIEADALDSPERLEQTSDSLFDLQRRAREFDAGWLHRSLFGELSVVVRRTVEHWSRALAKTYDSDAARSAAMGVPLQDGIYRKLFWREALLCPDCTYNLDNRWRGCVELPPALHGREVTLQVLCRVRADPDALFAFRPTPQREILNPGTYRLLSPAAVSTDPPLESTFFVATGWPRLQQVELYPPRAELLKATKLIRDGRVLHGEQALLVADYRILDHLVTNAEFERFLIESGYQPLVFRNPGENRADDAPAWVDFASAMAFATWAGGQLPLQPEFELAVERKALPRPDASMDASGEYVLDLFALDPLQPTWIPYGKRALSATNLASRTSRSVGDKSVPAGFRVSFLADKLETYRQLADVPLRPK